MGKNVRGQESSSNNNSMSLHNGGNPGNCMNKVLHALNRRHRWHNVRKVLPNKRQGSGKQIIDEGSNENTSQPPDQAPKKNKSKNEQEITEARAMSSKKFRIRSLISDEMAKRRGKQHWRRRSPSPSHSPKKKKTSEENNNCMSPSSTTKKKRKCDICAAMLTVSYLRQKAAANDHHMLLLIEEDQPVNVDAPEMPHSRIINGLLTKSFSFPSLPHDASTKTRDLELEELKHKLRGLKDIQTTKDKFILPMNQLKDIVGFPKPMLTRPESFRSTTSRKDRKQTQNQSKSLKQKIGYAIKVDGRKEKRRILMDAVFHKIPYGRKSSKDPKKVGPDKLKPSKTATDHRSSTEKPRIKKTSSTSDAMSRYRKLLSQTSTRDEKLHHATADHRPRLFVAGERKTHKRIRSLPNISPYDFVHNQEFPVKPTMGIHLNVANGVFDEQRLSADPFVYLEERKNTTGSIKGKETKLSQREEFADESLGVGTTASNHQEIINPQNESESEVKAPTESVAKQETSLIETVQENLQDSQEQDNHQQQVVDESQETINNQNEPRVAIEVENDKSFNEILGMFKKVSDERKKLNDENESSGVVRKVAMNTMADKVHKNLEVGKNILDHQEKDKSSSEPTSENMEHKKEDTSPLKSMCEVDKDKSANTLDQQEDKKSPSDEVNWSTQEQDLVTDSSPLISIPNTRLEDYSHGKKQYKFGINDQGFADEKLTNNKLRTNDDDMMTSRFLHLDLESVKDRAEFQFVKQVLEKAGFLKNEVVIEWYSSHQPIDPVLFEEVEASFLQAKILEELNSMKDEEVAQKIINDQHLLLFDLINEALLEIYNRTYTYCPHPLTYRSKVSLMPVGTRVLEQVWDIVNMYLSWKPELQPSLDDVVSRDLDKGDGWMNLQGDAEFVGIELEELLVDDLLDELVFDDLLM